MAITAKEPRRSELLRISETLKKVPAEPATTFYEAIQSVHFFLSNLFGLYPLGRPDRYLYPFYQQDIACGRLTKEDAQELIDQLCLGVSTRVFSRAACGFIVGGQDKDGNLIENDLTWMFVTALDHIQQPDPNGALAVNEKTSDALLRYCAEVLSHGTTHPAFYNDTEIVASLRKLGVSDEDSVNYIHTTCAEISVVGRSRAHSTAFTIDMPQILLETVKANPRCVSYDQLEQAYFDAMLSYAKRGTFRYFSRMLEASRNSNDPMRICCLVEDCIARGKGIFEGGERYTFLQPIFVGFANTSDSLLAIKKLVYEDKKLSLQAFLDIVHNNFEGNEALRQYIIQKLPHYGNDQDEADLTAKRLSDGLKMVFHSKILGGNIIVPGSFSYVQHAKLGAKTSATFDGRKAGYSYSDGCSPAQGRDTNGPTAMVLSLTSWNQSEFLGGMVVNIKFGAEHLSEKHRDRFLQILRTFMQRGGLEMQVNVVDRKTLIDAREHPEAYGDLIVRIGGYSDYFVRLTPTLQQEIIDRTEY
jgi:formate C-acetyltransferase